MLKVYQLRLNQNTFEVTLKYRGVGVRVAFVDGNTYNGVPAKCYTNDPFKQRAIEASEMFKNKEIVLERSIEEESDRKARELKAKNEQLKKQGQKDQNPPIKEEDQNPPIKEEDQNPPLEEQKPDKEDDDKKTFANLAEAIMFIAQNYQVQVTSAAEARKVLKEHGVTATIKNG